MDVLRQLLHTLSFSSCPVCFNPVPLSCITLCKTGWRPYPLHNPRGWSAYSARSTDYVLPVELCPGGLVRMNPLALSAQPVLDVVAQLLRHYHIQLVDSYLLVAEKSHLCM